jgi:prepilin-type N-terminal cleavage/methylation domain-containing protein
MNTRLLRGPRPRGFTLVELLVVVGIITILAGLLLPAIIYALGTADLTLCLSNMRQMGQASTNYYKDFDSWMVSCGAPVSISATAPTNGPFREPPMDLPGTQALLNQGKFPYWYVALAPYVNPAATWKNALTSYCVSEGKTPAQVTDNYYIYREIAKLCMLYTCPSKKQAMLGYGYNYAAPYGESILYPFDNAKYGADYPSLACRSGSMTQAQKDAAQDQFCWPYGTLAGDLNPSGYRAYPCFLLGEPAPLPILWYGQSTSFATLTQPTAQIAICDTGLVTNAPVWDNVVINPKTGRTDWRMTDEVHPPGEWTEFTSGRAANCENGYVRFPLSKLYTGEGKTWSSVQSLKIGNYKRLYSQRTDSPDGSGNSDMNTGWRPVPRHNKRTACLYFDGRAMAHGINDVVSAEWGDRNCLFDNKPSSKSPAPKYDDTGIGLSGWLPTRNADGTVNENAPL